MVVNPSVPAKTVPEFIAYAKANPDKINYASAGIGGPTHIFGELFKMMAGVDLLHVPYRGSFLPDLLGGQVQSVFSTTPPVMGHMRALAVTTATRFDALPDLPTIGDFLPGYEATIMVGLSACKNTPVEIVDRLNKETNAALDPGVKAKLAGLGVVPLSMAAANYGKLIADQTEKWGKVIRTAGIKAE